MIELKNDKITATIDEDGARLAQLHSELSQHDYLVDQTNLVLFPAIGKSFADSYRYQSRSYPMPVHGFAKDSHWQIYQQSDSAITLELRDSPESRTNFPFYFQFLITYQLKTNGIEVLYQLANMGNVAMAFSLGAQLTCPLLLTTTTALTDYQLTLLPQRALTLTREMTAEQFRTGGIRPNRQFQHGQLSLGAPELNNELLVLTNRDMESLKLTNQKHHESLTISSQDFPYFAMQLQPEQQQLQLGLWNGLPDKEGLSSELLRKEGNLTLPARDNLVLSYQLTIK